MCSFLLFVSLPYSIAIPEKKSNLSDKNLWLFSLFLLKSKLSGGGSKARGENPGHIIHPLFSPKTNILFTGGFFKHEKSRDYHRQIFSYRKS